MPRRYTGGFLSSKEQVTDANSASGIFTTQEAGALTTAGSFPTGRWTPQRSLRVRSAVSAYLNRTPAVAGNRQIFTYSVWVKLGPVGTSMYLISANTASGFSDGFGISTSSGQLALSATSGNSTVADVVTSAYLRDPSAWYHIVAAVNTTEAVSSNRIKIYINGVQATISGTFPSPSSSLQMNNTGAHYIGRLGYTSSVMWDGYMSEINSIDGQALDPSYFGATDPETGTWVPKRYTGTYGTNGFYLPFSNNSTTTALGLDMSPSKNMLTYSEQMDNAAWSKTNLNVTTNTANDPISSTLTVDKLIPTATNGEHTISQGTTVTSSTYYTYSVYAKVDGYNYIQINEAAVTNAQAFFDLSAGTAATATSNDQSLYDATSRIQSLGNGWYRCSVTYKTGSSQTGMTFNTYILNNSAASSYAGNGTSGVLFWGAQINPGSNPNGYSLTTTAGTQNNWTPNYISVTAGVDYDSMVDVPGIASVSSQPDVGGVQRGNYATYNPLVKFNSTPTFKDGNLNITSNATNYQIGVSTIGIPPNSGKWYWETTASGVMSSGTYSGIMNDAGIKSMTVNSDYATQYGYGTSTYSSSASANNYYYYAPNTSLAYSPNVVWNSGDTVCWAYDSDNGRMWIGRNGVWNGNNSGIVGNPSTGSSPLISGIPPETWYPASGVYQHPSLGTTSWLANFGQRAFAYTVPTGFKSICTTNLPNPVIKRPRDHFDIKLYTGTGTSLQVGTTAKETSAFSTSSLEFKSEQTSYLTRTPAAAGNRRTWTWSAWVKRAKISTNDSTLFNAGTTGIGSDDTGFLGIRFTSSDKLDITTGGTDLRLTTQSFNDTTSWYHIVVAFDTTQVNVGNRLKLYVNGTQITSFQNLSNPSLNLDTAVNNNVVHEIGRTTWTGTTYFDGYMSEVNFIDGQALTPSSFGIFDANNNWMPQRYTGTYGTNGFYLPLSKPTDTPVMSYGAAFNGSTAWLSTVNNAALNLGSSDFTAEAWVYNTGSAVRNSSVVFNKSIGGAASDSSYYFGLAYNGMSLYLSTSGTAWTHGIEGECYPVGWGHCVWQRRSNVLELYFNGKLLSTASTTGGAPAFSGTVFSSTRDLEIGRQSTTGGYFSGWISNARLVVGSAVYAGNFTPPTSALTAITNTRFLTLQNSTIIDNSTNAFSITNNSVQTPIDVSPWQRTVGYDASGSNNNLYPVNFDYSVPRSNVLIYGTPGTYTWVAPTGVTSVKALVIAGGGAGGTNGGGGGAGGMIYNAAVSVTPGSSYTVTVGRGGHTRNQGNATNSVFSSLTAVAGGNGATYALVAAQNGGSGGGGTLNSNTAGTGTAGQGNAGGAGNNGNSGNTYYHGGGGGAGTAGTAGASGGAGGAGLVNSITGIPIYYAGGGAGFYFSTNTPIYAAGGIGGGGSGQNSQKGPAAGGRPNSGGGGAGVSGGLGGGPGGSGVVILSYTNAASYDGVGANSIIASDISRDTPTDFEDTTGVSGNYPILNYPNYTISNSNSGNTWNITNAGLTLMSDDSGSHKIVPATMPISSGKWYFEMILENNSSDAYSAMGLIPWPLPNHTYLTNLPSSVSGTNGFSWQTGTASNLTLWIDYDSTYRYVTMNSQPTASAIGDVMQIAVDIDNNKIWAGRNNTWYDASGGSTGNPSTGANPTATNVSRYIGQYGALVPFCSVGQENMVTANFGQTGFMYTPPTGFKAINSKNIKDVGSTNLPDTFGNFVNTPDLVWSKNRSNARNHALVDTIRGATNQLRSDTTAAQFAGGFSSIIPNGFTLNNNMNENNIGETYVAWNWNRGRTPGFDIVNYAGAGAGTIFEHNLGVEPSFVTIKCTSTTGNWITYHKSLTNNRYLYLNSTGGEQTQSNAWTPTSNSFSINQLWSDASTSGLSYIAYLWAEVPGFSKFGSYTGNASATDGPFIYTGFRPRFVMIKRTSSGTTGNWSITDTAINPSNTATLPALRANTSDSESTVGTVYVQLLSNGFKITNNNTDTNGSSNYIYIAFAETPFKYVNAR